MPEKLPHNMKIHSRDIGGGKIEVNGVVFVASSHTKAIKKYLRYKEQTT